MEVKTISKKLKRADHRGYLWFKEYEFERCKVIRDRNGNITGEFPYKQRVFLLAYKKQALWLTPEQIFDLKDMLYEEEAEKTLAVEEEVI